MGVTTEVVGLNLQYSVALLTAANPGTQSLSGVALLEKRLAIHRKKQSEFIDLVAVFELSVAVGMGSVAVVETLLNQQLFLMLSGPV